MPKPTGKGGNFDERKNPFYGGPKRKDSRPKLDEFPELLKGIELLLAEGDAILLGATRDGGALVFTILHADQRLRTYCSNDTEVMEVIEAMNNMYAET